MRQPLRSALVLTPLVLLPELASAADLSSLRFGEERLSTGVTLTFAEQGDPAGEPVILLHGYSDSWFSFSGILPFLPSRYHVFALDQRGHGESDQPEGGYSMDDLAADVLAFMDARGMPSATLVGHSMGSIVAQRVALAAPQRVERLVLLGSGTSVRVMPGFDDFRQAVEGLTDPVPEEFARAFQESTIYQPLAGEFMERVVKESLKLRAHVWRGIMDGFVAAPRFEGLDGTRIPTLILWGDRDSVFLREEQDALLALIPGARLKVYDETGHALHWERPEPFARDLEVFFQATSFRTQ